VAAKGISIAVDTPLRLTELERLRHRRMQQMRAEATRRRDAAALQYGVLHEAPQEDALVRICVNHTRVLYARQTHSAATSMHLQGARAPCWFAGNHAAGAALRVPHGRGWRSCGPGGGPGAALTCTLTPGRTFLEGAL
jgi:hypothetical protein